MLELARRELARHEPGEPDPVWLEVFDAAALRGHSGSCLLDLGQPRRAIAPLLAQDAAAPRTFLRNRVIWLLDRATAHLDLAEVDGATEAVGEALDVSTGTASRRTVGRFHTIDGRFRAWADKREVAEIRERLRLFEQAAPKRPPKTQTAPPKSPPKSQKDERR